MLVSIIVPVYNVEKYLAQCLDSISTQTYRDIEVIVVNDGSTDKSLDICDEYVAKDNRIRLISKKNGGLVSAWKEGVSNATGKYIAFIDSDDFVSNDYIECMVNHLDDDTDMVCMNCIRYSDTGKQIFMQINALQEGIYYLNDDFYESFIIGEWREKSVANSRWAKLIRADIVKNSAEHCSEEVSFGEDQQFTVGALLECTKILILNEYKYFYRFNPTSIVNSYKKNLWNRSKLLIKTIQSIPCIEKVGNIEDQLKLQLLLYLFECLKNEQFYGGGLKKEYFLQLLNEANYYRLFAVQSKRLCGRMDKILFSTVKNGRYMRTKFVLNFYRLIKHI